MLSRVIVHPPGGYEKWLAGTIAMADSLTGVDRGKMLYETRLLDLATPPTARPRSARPGRHLRKMERSPAARDEGRRELPAANR